MNVATPWIRKESKHGVRVRRDQAREAAGHTGGETREAPGLVRGGTDFTRAAHAAGAYKRTGKVWRNGRTRPTGRNERPLSDRCRGDMDKPRRTDAGHLCMDERIAIADMYRAGSGVRAIARTPGGAPGTNENTNGLPRQYSPQGNRPVRIHRGTPRRSRHGTQREDPRTDRRHRNINTNRHQQYQLSTKMLRQPLESANDIQQTPQPNAGVDRVFRTHDPAL